MTDIAKYKKSENAVIVVNWTRNYSNISFLGLWERLHNLDFKPIEFDRFTSQSGDNAFGDYASAEELAVLINLEDTNAELNRRGLPQLERLKLLREKTYRQLEIFNTLIRETQIALCGSSIITQEKEDV